MLVGNEIALRWMNRSDMMDVLAIERMSYRKAWELKEFAAVIRDKAVIGRVVEVRGTIQGYIIYELHRQKIEILNIAVAPDMRIQGLGSLMLQPLFQRVHHSPLKHCIEVFVADDNLGAHLFFKALTFWASGVHRCHLENGQDAYRFVYGF